MKKEIRVILDENELTAIFHLMAHFKYVSIQKIIKFLIEREYQAVKESSNETTLS